MQRVCPNITPRPLTRQTKTDDVKLKHMTSLTGLALRYFARDVKLTAAASGFLNHRLIFILSLKCYSKPFSRCKLCLHPIKHAELKEMDEKWLGSSYY